MSQAPSSCVCLATSKGCQGVYVSIAAIVLAIYLSVAWVSVITDIEGGDESFFYIGEWVCWLLITISGIVMIASRCCAPQCYPDSDLLPCCPCSCFCGLDGAYYGLFGFTAVAGTLDLALAMVLAADTVNSLALFRIMKLVGPILVIAALACAIVKVCAMCGCCCTDLVPKATSQPNPGTQQTTVVGQPVTVAAGVQQKVVD
mmetsp:Transcript_21996/g.38713  ORF Transcript_21996/g.38713 Transcript_21996/m.38713 type:complete len:202 (-) Transcript_21996:114-719(-)